MTTVYVDLVSGDDSLGDGSAGNPWKTIAFADNGLTGGDEIRVKKTTVQTASDTMTWTNDSATVNTSADESGNISGGDSICKVADFTGTEGWWQVSAIDTTTITLYQPYNGTTETVTTYYLHDAGQRHDTLASDGLSISNRLLCTGGWDLTGPTRDGYTYMDPGLVNYNTLYLQTANYVECAYFVCAGSFNSQSYKPFNQTSAYGCYIHDIYGAGSKGDLCLGNLEGLVDRIIMTGPYIYSGINITAAYTSTLKNLWSHSHNSGTYRSFYITSAFNSYFENLNALDSGNEGIYLYNNCTGNFFYDCTSTGNTKSGLNMANLCEGNYFKDCDFSNNTTYGAVFGTGSRMNWLNNCDLSGCGTAEYYAPMTSYNYGIPKGKITSAAGVSTVIVGKSLFTSDTADARSGTCLKFRHYDSNEPNYPYVVGAFKVPSTATDITLNIYMKKDATFNGKTFLIASLDGRLVVERTEKTMTTSYVEYSITVLAAKLVQGKYLDLRYYGFGTTGYVFLDDFSWSQA